MGKIANGVKNFIRKIINIIKFIPTVLGQICFWLMVIILAIVLIYLLINILANAIADILGIEDAGLTTSEDYELLSQITVSGYDVIMPADELQEYYAYEYAVLMDLARNLEEAGTYLPVIIDTAEFDPSFLDVNEWAKLCAESFLTDDVLNRLKTTNPSQLSTAAASYDAVQNAVNSVTSNLPSNATQAQVQAALTTALSGTVANGNQAYIAEMVERIMAQLENAKPSNEKSKDELIYKSVTSDTTGETSLVPYLVVYRPVQIFTYSFIDKTLASGEYEKDYSDILREGRGGGHTAGDISFNISPTATLEPGQPTQGYTWQYIASYIRPLEANGPLNANNVALYRQRVPGSSAQLDITAPYSESVFHATKNDACVTYEIPVKVLADRFMPKAVLLSSWYMLKQDESPEDGSSKAVDLILSEIKQIYNKACLDGETQPDENWLLVKDVTTTDTTTEDTINLRNLLKRSDFSSLTVMDRYAFKQNSSGNPENTDILYEKYNTKYDSREFSVQPATNPPQNPSTPQTPVQETILEPYTQQFGGNLKDDIIDDLDLVLTHHNEIATGFMNEKQYEKAMADFIGRLGADPELKDVDSINQDDDKIIIYKTDENGKYIINCTEMPNEKHHVTPHPSGATHQAKYNHEYESNECYEYVKNESKHQDPYSNSASVECFIPHIIVSFARVETDSRETPDGSGGTVETDVTVKATAVIIIDGDTKYLYRVDSREMEDLAGISNNVSFMKFDRYDAQMSNIGDWEEENSASTRKDRLYFVVTDLCEARPFSLNNIGDCVSLHMAGRPSDRDSTQEMHVRWTDEHGVHHDETSVSNWLKNRLSTQDIQDVINNDSEVQQIVNGLNFIKADTWGIIRPKDPTTGQYDLEPPKNASPAVGQGYTFPTGYQYATDGESVKLTTQYVNLKNLDPTILDTLVDKVKDAIEDAVKTEINDFFNDGGTITYITTDGTEKQIGASFFQPESTFKVSITEDDILGDPVALFTVKERITTINQTVKQRQMPMYLPRYADTWSSEKRIRNELEIMGEFDHTCSSESGGYFQLIPRTNVGGGLSRINTTVAKTWRTQFYAEHFSKVRESDVLAMIAEWEKAGQKGHFAAYTYIRDIYSLLQKSKNVVDENGLSYVHEDSYTYMYVPDEILYFDESVTDKAYWFERLLATSGADSIKPEENLTMRNKRSVKTWQVVDYEKYEECETTNANGDTIYNVYALWPLGGYLGRALYSFEANASPAGNNKIISWGWYVGPGVHSGVDLYGRSSAEKVYRSAFDENGEAKIKATYNGGNVTLVDTRGNTATIGDDDGIGVEANEATISGGTDTSLYINQPVTIKIDDTDVTFSGGAAAVYGYELYRLTKAYKDGEKAEATLKEALQKERTDTPLVALAPGIVEDVSAGFRPGFKVTVEHVEGGKVRSSYVHMKRWPEAQIGEYVGAGTILGYEGTTGNSGGNHIHHEITVDGKTARYPIPYLYPFFTPFYYEDKAAENEYKMESDYMSLIRTVFPYGEHVDSATVQQALDYDMPSDQSGTLKQVETADGKILIKNYTPSLPLCTSDQLHTADEVDEKADLINEIDSADETGGVNYSGDDVIALPHYFDLNFIAEVLDNNGHILKPTP